MRRPIDAQPPGNRAYASPPPSGPPSGPPPGAMNGRPVERLPRGQTVENVQGAEEPGRPGFKWDRATQIGDMSVFERSLPDGGTHFAVATPPGVERPTFQAMQDIKNQLAGEDRQAVEIYPVQAKLVDDGPESATHLFVLPQGQELPYSLPARQDMPAPGAAPSPAPPGPPVGTGGAAPRAPTGPGVLPG